jgi:hypothetical protein
MRFVRTDARFVVAALLAIVLAACSGQKHAAQNLVFEIAATLSAAEPEAAKYVPEQVQDIQAKLADLRASFDKGDYAGVMAAAPAVLAATQSLATAAAAQKDQILKAQNDAWTDLAAVLPDEVTALQNRVEQLNSKMPGKKAAKGLPSGTPSGTSKGTAPGVDLAAASAGMADITSLWSKAQAAFASGNLEEALATAKDVKTRADALAATLKMDPAPAAGAT